MNGKAKRGAGLFLVLLGTLLIAAALTLVFYNILDGNRAAQASQEILEKMDALKNGEDGSDGGENAEEGETETEAETETPKEARRKGMSLLDMVMPMVNIDGYNYIGTLLMPSLNLKLPVMASWDYDRLKISPCRYSGSYYTDDLVICAHNYQRHFSPIKGIAIGAEVIFINVEDEAIHYIVSNRETIEPTAIDQMVENLNNSKEEGVGQDWDLTLFTCNTGGQTRCAVRCIRKE